jgi:hypothetical protein
MPQNTNRNRRICCLVAHQKHNHMLHTASQSFVQLEALKRGYFFKKIFIHSKARKPPQKIKQRVHERGPQVNQITT